MAKRFTAEGDARGADRRVARMAATLQRDLNATVKQVGEDAEILYSAHALRRTGRMARGVTSVAGGNLAFVRVHARNPETGYDYVGVTRFGHRSRRIEPKTAKALRIPVGGGFILRKFSRGFHPKTDWADKALPQVKLQAERRMELLGWRVAVRFGG